MITGDALVTRTATEMIPTPPNAAPPEPLPSTAPEPPRKSHSFAFQAQADDGQRLSGTIDAADADAVLDRLQGMGLRVIDVKRVEAAPNGGGKSPGTSTGNA